MADVLRFVRGDTAPQLKLTITDSVAGTALNLTGYVVTVYIRAANGNTVLLTKVPTISNQSTNPGECLVTWSAGDLLQAAGNYEAEIELYNSSLGIRETVYDLVSLSIRAEIGPVPGG